MRDIEFRGKRLGSGEWVHGRGYLADNGTIGYPAPIYSDRHGEWREICDETLGRYTGLRGKNGKKIFEGDIASFGGDKYRIIFDDACFWINNVRDAGYSMELHALLGQGDIEVIGNIHDSPALFGGAK